MKRSVLSLLTLFVAASLHAAVKTQTIQYKDGKTVLEGTLAYNDDIERVAATPGSAAVKRPAVLVVHDWMGPGAYSRRRAEQLAELGYIAFAADIYGKDVRPKDAGEAGKVSASFKKDIPLLRRRARAGLDALLAQKWTDASRVAAIGYCFGGTTVLELARGGAPVKGVVSYHGGLGTTNPADAKNIKGAVLVLHGADDPYVPPDEVAAFQKEMNDANVDWQFVSYADAVHAFTVPEAGTDTAKGAAYNEKADRRSWEAMKTFFVEIFR